MSEQNWRQFQGTELGPVMARLYGNENRPVINYPKPKSKKFEPHPTFIPGGASHNATDPRKTTRNYVNIDIPIPTGGKMRTKFSMVDAIPKRRGEETIQKEMDDIRMRQAYYRPAHSQATSSDMEKDKLAQICQYKGGKGLPEELTVSIRCTEMHSVYRCNYMLLS